MVKTLYCRTPRGKKMMKKNLGAAITLTLLLLALSVTAQEKNADTKDNSGGSMRPPRRT